MTFAFSARASSLLSFHSVSFNLPDGRLLFEGVDFDVGPGKKVGLVGANGGGKSSLLRLAAGLEEPSSGRVRSWSTRGYLPQVPAPRTGSIRDLWGEEFRRSAHSVGLKAELLDRDFGDLSGGERLRVELFSLLRNQPELLLLDEPTNHLDREGRIWLQRFAAQWRGGLLIASHDRELLDQMDAILELRGGRIRSYGGAYSEYARIAETERAAAEAELGSAEASVRKSERAARDSLERQMHRMAAGKRAAKAGGMPRILIGARKRRAQGTLARLQDTQADRVDDARDRVRKARERVGEEHRILVDLPETAFPEGKEVLRLVDLNLVLPGQTAPFWENSVNLALSGPRRVALLGPNGSGKSLLMKTLMGTAPARIEGAVKIGSRQIAFLDQKLALLDPAKSVLQNLRERNTRLLESELRNILGRHLFAQERSLQRVATLSGGERMRAALACVLHADPAPQLLLLDEPANDLDLRSLAALASALSRFRGALVIVSHDERFLADVGVEKSWRVSREGVEELECG